MTEHDRELLTSLRCDINLIRDCPFSAVRDTAIRMLALIDTAMALPLEEPKSLTIETVAIAELLRETIRRVQAVRRVHNVCGQCKSKPARARNLCVRCYKRAYRRGEIQNASR